MGDDPAHGRQPVKLRFAVELAPEDAGLCLRRPPWQVDPDPLHRPKIDQQPSSADCVPGDAVATRTDCDQQIALAREAHAAATSATPYSERCRPDGGQSRRSRSCGQCRSRGSTAAAAPQGGAIRAGQLTMTGPRTMQRRFGHWFTWSAFAPASRAAQSRRTAASRLAGPHRVRIAEYGDPGTPPQRSQPPQLRPRASTRLG
jgi:hypothetical protein